MAAFQAFNNATKKLRLPTIKEIEHMVGNQYERLLTFEGLAESADTNRVLQNLVAYFVTGSLPQRLLLVESYMPVLKQEQMYRWMWYGFYIIP